jgi:hypothetical protein
MEADAGRGARPGLALALALVLGALAAAVWLLS